MKWERGESDAKGKEKEGAAGREAKETDKKNKSVEKCWFRPARPLLAPSLFFWGGKFGVFWRGLPLCWRKAGRYREEP